VRERTNGVTGHAAAAPAGVASAPARLEPAPPVKATAHDVVRIAARAVCAPNTVKAYLRGEPGRSTTRAKIEQALHKCGLGALVRRAG